MAQAPPDVEDRHAKTYEAFAKNVSDLSDNLFSIAKDGAEGPDGKGGDPKIANLPNTIRIIENWLLNLTSRADLLMGYVKRVYVNKKALDEGNGDALIDDEEYFYGDVAFAKPYAPLFTILWKNHMTKKEKPMAINFFRTYNAIVEDWIADGAYKLFDKEKRAFDYNVLRRIAISIKKMDKVPEEELAKSQEMQDHYALLAKIREEFLALRKPKDEEEYDDEEEEDTRPSKTTTKPTTTKETVKVSVSKHKDHYDVVATDVKVVTGSSNTSVTATKVKGVVSAKSASGNTSNSNSETKKLARK